MDKPYSAEWWRWRMYRKVADYLHDPSVGALADINAQLHAYRMQHENRPDSLHEDEHEWAMEWQ